MVNDLKSTIRSADKVKDYLSMFGEDQFLETPETKPAKDSKMYFKGNKLLRRAGAEIPLTSWQLNEIYESSDDIFHFQQHVKIRTSKKGVQSLELRSFQVDMIKAYVETARVITVASRQIGKTTVNNFYVLWYALFNSDQNIWIIANKGKTAKQILKRLKIMYESLPLWMQQGIINWNAESIELENGTTINVSTTTSESVRGEDISLLILDEFGRIPPHIEEGFVEAVLPAVSSDDEAQIIIVSTANGISNTFYRMYHEAELGRNEYVHFSYAYDVIPERNNPEWVAKALADLKGDERKFAQEYKCDFQGSSKTLVKSSTLKDLLPERYIEEVGGARYVYDHVKEDRRYVGIIDIAKGTGRCSSTIQMLDITEYPVEQVARYESNNINTFDFSKVADAMGREYNGALLIVENNGIGQAVCDNLKYKFEYPNLLETDREVGICTTFPMKETGANEFKLLVESGRFKIKDDKTIRQLSTFVKVGSAWKPDVGCYSDLVMPLIIFGYCHADFKMREMLEIRDPSEVYEEEDDIDEDKKSLMDKLLDNAGLYISKPATEVRNTLKCEKPYTEDIGDDDDDDDFNDYDAIGIVHC